MEPRVTDNGVRTETDDDRPLRTRAGLDRLAKRMLDAVAAHTSPGGAHILVPGPASASGRRSDGLEGFARTFLLAAVRVRGADGAGAESLAPFARGLRAGVDPASAERWPTIAERRQAVVEAASVAIALSETRPWLWDLLDDGDRARTVDWLAGIIGTSGYTNNWTWFQTVIETFLRSVGGPWSAADLDRNREIQESLYVGEGWYSDGASPAGTRQSFDYYAGWAWHVYPLLAARIAGVELADEHRDRLRAFVPEAMALISPDGRPVLQGRSATYRFAVLAPLWTAVIAGVSPLAPGVTRTVAARTIGSFLQRGALDDSGLLTIGWHGRFAGVRQPYTSGGSPYWSASKGLLGLLLPDGHAEWTASEPVEPEPRDEVRALVAPGWIVSRTADDGIVRLYNHGSDGWRHTAGGARADNPFYHRVAYSNATSPELSRRSIAEPVECHVALLDEHGAPSHRDAIERVHLSDRVAVSRSRVHWFDGPDSAAPLDAALAVSQRGGPELTVASVVNGPSEVRLAWWLPPREAEQPSAIADLDAAWRAEPGPWRIRFGGWAVPEGGDLQSALDDVSGLESAETVRRSGGSPVAASTTEATVTPVRTSRDPVPPGRVVAAVVTLTGSVGDAVGARCEAVDGGIRVRWSDGRIETVPVPDGVSL
ncbi:DUF2264 domain-containing protein [Microbacterium radiodurans]|nr:DUF2264 domain-containing protein [Microbacterium radiodurans]